MISSKREKKERMSVFTLRIERSVLEGIKKVAKKNGRSTNKEMVKLIELYLKKIAQRELG